MTVAIRTRVNRDARRDSIVDVAAEVFLAQGYDAASMGEIAARLGGSKATLYVYFKNKDELFRALVERCCAWQRTQVENLGAEEGPARETLVSLGRQHLVTVTCETSIRQLRLVMGAASHDPQSAALFHEASTLATVHRLAGQLEPLRRRGELDLWDLETGARQLMALCEARLLRPRLLNIVGEPSADEIASDAGRAATTFLRAYGLPR